MKYPKDIEKEMIKYFRFRLLRPSKTKITFMTIKSISKFINRSMSYVQ